MSTFRELTYSVLDELKLSSDDSTFTEDHVMFFLDKYRAFLLKQRYSDVKKQIPSSNYQTICLDLIQVPAIPGEPCEGGVYLRSKDKVPFLMQIGVPRVYPIDYYQGDITYISRDRMRYVGYNKFLKNIIYCSIGPDNYLYFKSCSPQHLYLEHVRLTGIFLNSIRASDLQCPDEEGNIVCDILDREFPIEDSLISPLIELTVKLLSGASYRPADPNNNAKDDLADMASFIARNTKSNFQKQLE
jgi:hypothetical protein